MEICVFPIVARPSSRSPCGRDDPFSDSLQASHQVLRGTADKGLFPFKLACDVWRLFHFAAKPNEGFDWMWFALGALICWLCLQDKGHLATLRDFVYNQ